VPARRDQAGGQVRDRREDEQPVGHRRMGNLQESGGGSGIEVGGQRQALGRALDAQPRAAEEQQVEVDLARTPAPPLAAPEVPFESLQPDEEVRRARRWRFPRRRVERHGRVQEIGLVDDADWLRQVQPRDAAEPHAREGRQGDHRVRKRPPRIAHIRPQPDVRPNSRHDHLLTRAARRRRYSRRVQPVSVRILHPRPGESAGPLERSLAAAREANAARLAGLFRRAGAQDVRIDAGEPEKRSFGARLRALATELPKDAGLIVAGSGAIPTATRGDVAAFVRVAASGEARALANSFYSADVVAIGRAASIRDVPDLANDNVLPRWLSEHAGVAVEDLARRWRLALDLDSPLDGLLVGARLEHADHRAVDERLARLRVLASDPDAELVIAGRTSSGTLRWLERATASRTRALVEERGMRTWRRGGADRARRRRQRPPRSVLGLLLDARGPRQLGATLAELGDGALVDSRVLLAHRLGPDEAAWPSAEDRFASDLLLPDVIVDPWLRALTVSAAEAAIPILLGGHSLVGPGVRLALGPRR
jgi:hypothetical protein